MRSSTMSSRNGCENLGTTINNKASTAGEGTLGQAHPPWDVENTIDTLVPRL